MAKRILFLIGIIFSISIIIILLIFKLKPIEGNKTETNEEEISVDRHIDDLEQDEVKHIFCRLLQI